jgi:hypothetical protein
MRIVNVTASLHRHYPDQVQRVWAWPISVLANSPSWLLSCLSRLKEIFREVNGFSGFWLYSGGGEVVDKISFEFSALSFEL